MKNLSKKQAEIVNSTENKIVVIAAAAAGKTTILTERVKKLLKDGVTPEEIVVITFTNAAAEELNERLQIPKGLFIGTIHSYAAHLLASIGIDIQELIEDEEFDQFFEKIKSNPHCVKKVQHLLLDEAQDSNKVQFEFLIDIVKPKNYMIVGDWRQSIYRWNGAEPENLIELVNNPNVKTYQLNENYRNGSKILEYAKGIINLAGSNYVDNSIAMSQNEGKVHLVEFAPDRLVTSIKKLGDYKDWFILTRTNAEIEFISKYFKKYGVPYDTFKRSELQLKDFNKKMNENTVKILTIHTSKGLEAKNVVVIGAKLYTLEECCVSYVAATRAKETLVWTKQQKRNPRKKINLEQWC